MRAYDIGCLCVGCLAAIGLLSWTDTAVAIWASLLMVIAYWLGSRR
jgi:hypothetical protein